ncbi:ABC transporter ATP-binding protein [Thalassotalea eurytherma]|uniref:ABC transporter ATP-binding protein YhaQ n=1 Tax=Thalassotalea eurytherma TaxID=1144278 RepID=A0ABQ6H5E0_9GAMM|nr:ATP-binding cassette domain-containing protein [Thalassotalea eurytherma]GLX83366.1 putative ABC transporter ATP-binding protein YhaQ [Thalassotalea eurytherma]
MELTVNQVTKTYGDLTAVNALSFHVSQGEIFALLGPNGAGKSSLVRMLTGFTHPDDGQISLNLAGQFFSHIPSQALGYLPEDRGLYPEKSVLKNLVYFARLHGMSKADAQQEATQWLEKFDLSDRLDEQLKSLSKGNQQKVQLISAVIHNPKWVILDEPFSGLDPVNQEKVVEFLTELKAKGMTVILSAHQMAMVEKLADRMLLMNLGEAVFYGSLHDIRQQAATNAVLKVTYDTIDRLKIQSSDHGLTIEQLTEESLQVLLQPSQSINDVLASLTTFGNIKSVHSQSLDLHQLYLHAISKHKEEKQQRPAKEKQYA